MSEPLNEPSPSADERQRRAVRRWSVRLAVLVVLAGVVLALWHPWRRRDPLAAFADIRFIDSVAVLSIENRTGEPAMAHLCAGITDEIVGRLKRVGLIKVSDPYSVEQLVALELTAGQLADSLGVEKLVVGSLYATADGVRLNMRVSNGATGELLSTRRYDWNADTRLETAPNLAQAFVDDYVDAIPLTAVPARPPPTTHSPGHEAYLIGRASLGRRTAAGLARARAAFSEALALDSAYADAYAGLSNVYALSLAYRYRIGVDGYSAAALALAAANRAIRLDPELAAEAAFRASRQAIALDPQNAGRRLALAYDALALQRYDRAAAEAHLAGALEPELMLPRAIEARAHLLAGRADRCAAMELGPHAGLRATCLYDLGQRAEASAIVDSLIAGLAARALYDTVYTAVIRAEDLAVYYAWAGDPAESLSWVRRAYDLSPSGVEPRVLESALFDRVREDPRFSREVEGIRAGIWDRVRRESETLRN